MESREMFNLSDPGVQEDIDLHMRLLKSMCKENHRERPRLNPFLHDFRSDDVYLSPR